MGRAPPVRGHRRPGLNPGPASAPARYAHVRDRGGKPLAGTTALRPRPSRRLAAIVALLGYAASLVFLLVAISGSVVALLVAAAALVTIAVMAFVAATHRNRRRWLAVAGAVVALGVLTWVLVDDGRVLDLLVVAVVWVLATALARFAIVDRARGPEPPAGARMPPPAHPVLLMNPRSGGGKVGSFGLVEECRRRGIDGIVLEPGDDLERLARDAVARGADALGMAGGDGSQAIVASVAAEYDLPYVCIPAGTRNHLALDLGVDRDDVVGSLDAFAEGYERRVDLARVNGRTFVNNVSLGVYAEIVQSDAYRDQKMQTTAEMLPELLGPDRPPFGLSVRDGNGEEVHAPCLVLISNNVYRLDRLAGFGSRARLDEGVLGIVTLDVTGSADVAQLVTLELAGHISRARGWRAWTATSEIVDSSVAPVAAGIDGEAVSLQPPLRFELCPAALRVRVARHAPGASPAALADRVSEGRIRKLRDVALGREVGPSVRDRGDVPAGSP
jgi:diacylglycerol kinase family enzyme